MDKPMREMTLEEEAALMRAHGMVLRTGRTESGNVIEYWDIPRTEEELAQSPLPN